MSKDSKRKKKKSKPVKKVAILDSTFEGEEYARYHLVDRSEYIRTIILNITVAALIAVAWFALVVFCCLRAEEFVRF